LDKLRYMTKLVVTAVSADIFDFASDSARNRPVTYTRQEWDALYVVFEMFQLFREYNREETGRKLTIEKVEQIKTIRSAPPDMEALLKFHSSPDYRCIFHVSTRYRSEKYFPELLYEISVFIGEVKRVQH